jgi:mono/diheme cytochrome c family protein
VNNSWAVLVLLAALASRSVVAGKPVPGTVPGTVKQETGKAAYAKAGCESCHGPAGNGRGQGPALVPFTLELSELITIVRQGVGLMPGTPRGRVSDEEISAIRQYLISVEK